ncbi:hypothetical protein G3O00_32140 [Burkholderia sp. Ac-20384]|uniref:hypothetical protein n=1 Tax=Burkholderia sp. Ac-20384 TaxID=2703902 RepID=UPI001980D9AD|nr:hypothetical protein [Burkholderia sp. Ac-20384]MBN3828228.1 hypothetical protein [Burkholderia sp. Ac-20384]
MFAQDMTQGSITGEPRENQSGQGGDAFGADETTNQKNQRPGKVRRVAGEFTEVARKRSFNHVLRADVNQIAASTSHLFSVQGSNAS